MTDGFTLFLSPKGFMVGPSPDALRGMNREELAAYERAQGDATNSTSIAPWMAAAMQNYLPPRKPTMTLAEYDAMRAAFHPS